jgi:Tol biopolymer transport system component
MRPIRPLLPILIRLSTGIVLLGFALAACANKVAALLPSLPIVYTHQYKVRILDLGRGIDLPVGGDYVVPSSFLHITPVMSPDRQWIAVQNGNAGVRVLNLARRTTALLPLPFAQPIWSPDSRYLATVPLQVKETMNIQSNAQWMDTHIADVVTGEVRQLTPSYQFIRIWAMGWSADSQRITFVAMKSPLPEYTFYMVNRDGSDLHPLECLLAGVGDASSFMFAPGGEQVAFVAKVGEQFNIFVLNLADCRRTQISDGAPYDDFPLWSPDGTQIAFLSVRDGQPDLYVMDADGSDVTRLSDSPANERLLSWSSDGHFLLYYSFPQAGGGITQFYADLRARTVHLFDLHNGQAQSFPAWGL